MAGRVLLMKMITMLRIVRDLEIVYRAIQHTVIYAEIILTSMGHNVLIEQQ